MSRRTLIAIMAVAAGTALMAGATTVQAGASPPTCHGKPATIEGTQGDDHYLYGDIPDRAVMVLKGGEDTAELEGTDHVTICGGDDHDKIDSGDVGNGTLIDGGAGRDVLGSLADADFETVHSLTLYGGPAKDTISGSGVDDKIFAGGGNDWVQAGNGDDVVKGGARSDRLEGQGYSDKLFGGEGKDELTGDSPFHDVYPPGDDLADGGPNFDTCKAEVKHSCEN